MIHGSDHSATALLGIRLVICALSMRLTREAIGESPVRVRLLEIVSQNIGVRLFDLARELGIRASSVSYHVRRLVKLGLLKIEKRENQVRVFASGACPPRRDEVVLFLGRASSAAILAELRAGGRTRAQLQVALGMPKSTLAWNVRRLKGCGAIVEARDKNGTTLRLANGCSVAAPREDRGSESEESALCGRESDALLFDGV